MGYAKIEAKKKELWAKQDVKSQFVDAAEAINKSLEQIAAAKRNLTQTKQKVLQSVNSLNPGDVKEFQEFKKELISACESPDPKPLSVQGIEMVVTNARTEVQKMTNEWMDKLAAAFPSQVTVGMVFKDYTSKLFYEIKKGPEKVQDKTRSGDEAVLFRCDYYNSVDGSNKGSGMPITLAHLKKMKFIKT